MKPSFSIPVYTMLMALTSATLMEGCASVPPPTAQIAVAEAAVQNANNSSTSEYAAEKLQIAIGKLARAKQASASGDNELARQMAEQAEIDARVAQLHAQAARSKMAAAETQEAARVLREEINRKSVQ